jgi:hypothetical protein
LWQLCHVEKGIAERDCGRRRVDGQWEGRRARSRRLLRGRR